MSSPAYGLDIINKAPPVSAKVMLQLIVSD